MNENSARLLVVSIASFSVVFSVCPPDDGSQAYQYVVIPESEYDRNYSSISTSGKRPLGFSQSIWYYNQPEESNPCIKVSGAGDRRLELMFETHPESRLCVSDQESVECSDPGTGRYYRCRRSSNDDVYFEFFCNRGEEYDVRFWYRIVLGPPAAEDPEDRWCDSRQQDTYPSSLLQLPQDYPLNVQTTTSPDTSSLLMPSSFFFILSTSLISIIFTSLSGF